MALLPSMRRRRELARRDPEWTGLTSLQREMNRVFDDFFSEAAWPSFREMEERVPRFAPTIDVKESESKIKVTAELPGLDEKDISISLKDGYLLITGEKKEEKKEDDEEYYHREVSYGSFRRKIPLDANIDADKVEAKFKKGVLKVTLPKLSGEEGPKGKNIEVRS